ncbi:hypothetical protein [Streptomyces sp. NPDC096132]
MFVRDGEQRAQAVDRALSALLTTGSPEVFVLVWFQEGLVHRVVGR